MSRAKWSVLVAIASASALMTMLFQNASGSSVIVINSMNMRWLSPRFLGQNIENAYSAGASAGLPSWSDPLSAQVLTNLNAGNLRYPGGTESNYWDWQEGWIQGCSDVTGTAGCNFSYAYHGAPPAGDTLPVYAKMANAAGVSPIYDLNVMTTAARLATPADNSAMIHNQVLLLQTASQLGMPVQYVELGNEFSFSNMGNAIQSDYTNRFPTGTNYATQMNTWISQIHAAFPAAQISLVGQPGPSSDPRSGSWNAQVYTTAIGAHALSFHNYIWEEDQSRPYEAVLNDAFDNWNSEFQSVIHTNANQGYHAWITEFGLHEAAKNSVNTFTYSGSWMSGLFVGEMILHYLSEPSIELAAFYQFSSAGWNGQATAYYLLDTKLGPPTVVNGQAVPLTSSGVGVFSPYGLALALIGRARAGALAASPIDLGGIPAATASYSYPAVDGIRFDSPTATQLVLFNFSGQPQTIDIRAIGTSGNYEFISAPDLKTFITATNPANSKTGTLSGGQLTLPAYSMNRIYNLPPRPACPALLVAIQDFTQAGVQLTNANEVSNDSQLANLGGLNAQVLVNINAAIQALGCQAVPGEAAPQPDTVLPTGSLACPHRRQALEFFAAGISQLQQAAGPNFDGYRQNALTEANTMQTELESDLESLHGCNY